MASIPRLIKSACPDRHQNLDVAREWLRELGLQLLVASESEDPAVVAAAVALAEAQGGRR